MFGTIRKHRTWLWLLIIGATIVSFVYFFTPTVGQPARGGGRENFGEINGKQITRDEYFSAVQEARLDYFFATGGFPGAGADFDEVQQGYQRLFLIHKLQESDIHVDDATVAQHGRDLLRRINQGQDVPLDAFETEVLRRNGLTIQDFARYLRHTLGIQQLISLAGLSGTLVTPEQARWLYVRDQKQLATEAVFFSASNYLSQVPEPAPEAVRTFYTNEARYSYTTPERIQINYVRFDLSNHIARAEQQLTNIAEIVDMNMEQMGTNYTTYGSTPEEARAKVRDLVLRNAALPEAHREAQAFANAVFDIDPVRSENLTAMAATNGLTLHTTPPFDRSSPPEDLDVGAEFINRVFNLSTNSPLDGPLIGEDGIYVIALERRIPSEVRPFEEVQDSVTTDYKLREAAELAREAGRAFSQTVSNGLAQGKSFAEISEAAGVTPVTVPPFSRSTRQLEPVQERMSLPQYVQVAFGTPAGKASDFSETRDGGVLIFVSEELPVDETKLATELPSFLQYLRMQRRQAAAELWFQREASEALGNIPALQRNAPGQPPPGS